MTVLVTGATGFIGNHVVAALLDKGVPVRCLVRPTADRRPLAGMDVEVIEGDLRDSEDVRRAVRGCTVIFHVAAFYSTRPEDEELIYAVNVVGTKNILAAARAEGVRCLVHTSTIGTIGRPPDGSLPTEDTPFNLWETSSPYARSKYLAEVAALEAAADLRVIVVNPTAPIGPRDWKPSSSGQRVVDALKGRIPSFLPGGINHVAVQDVALGHLLAAERGQPGRRYILGNQNLSLEDFLSLVEQASGQRVPRPGWRLPFPRPQPTQGKGRPWGLVCDCSRSVRELGLPQTPLLIAFHEAVQWFRGHGYVQRR